MSLADRLIAAAERLYGEHGMAGVSLRQICQAAGTGNNYAVQYHFGDAAGLIRSVHASRLAASEADRARLLAEAEARGSLTVRDLVEVLYRPILAHVDERGERVYARFLLALYSSPGGVYYTAEVFEGMPLARRIFELLCRAVGDLPPEALAERLRLIALLVLNSAFNRRPPFGSPKMDEAAVANAFDMATAALTAPLTRAP